MTTYINLGLAENRQLQLLAQGILELNAENISAGAGPKVLVSKDGALCSPSTSGDLTRLTRDSMAALIRSHCVPGKMERNPKWNPEDDPDEKYTFVEVAKLPRDLVGAYIDSGQFGGLPHVACIASTPMIRPDFTVRWEPGWDEATKAWVKLRLERDTSLLGTDPRRWLEEFALTDRRQEADCLAGALTPLLSKAMRGSLPAFLTTAQKISSGKSELSQLTALMGGAGGETLTRWPGREEFTKTVSAFIAGDEGVVIFDNVKSRVDSPDLESVITSRQTSFRRMHSHSTTRMRSNTVWHVTTNGAEVSPDMLRRCVVVLLDPERFPVKWTGDLRKRTQGAEAAIVTLMCSLVESWREAGCPPGSVKWPGFEEWSRVVSGILEHHGYAGMWEAREDIVAEAVYVEGEELGEIVEHIVSIMGGEEFKVSDLWATVDDPMTLDPAYRAVREFLGDGRKAAARMRKLKNRTFDGCPYRLEHQNTNSKRRWVAVALDGSALPVPYALTF